MTHIALCINDSSGTYYKNALVTTLSVLDNAGGRLCLHIVHDDTLSEQAKDAFAYLCEQYGQELRLHGAGDIPEQAVKNLPATIGRGTLYRTMLPSLLQVDKVLYLDCDIVCLADVTALYALDIGKNFLAAAKMPPWQAQKWIDKYGINSDFCINAGVLIMNLDRFRREMPDYADRVMAMAADPAIKACDQAATNLIFNPLSDAYRFLPDDYNFRTELADHSTWPLARYRGKILHFAGKKPWQVLTQPAFFYWKYYARLFPSEDVFARMEMLEPYEHAYLFSFILGDNTRRRRIRRLYEFTNFGFWKSLKKRLWPF